MVKSHYKCNLSIWLFIQTSKSNLNFILIYGESNLDQTDRVLILWLKCIKVENYDHVSN